MQTAADAFSGSSVVGYMYKTHGLGVHASDRLAYCNHIARAIVENDSTTLSDEEVAALLADNAQAKDFVRKNFKGIYFEPGVHAVIDTIRSNIDSTGIGGFKRDIALFALGKACITGKGGFKHFGTTKGEGGDNPKGFKERFAANCQRISALVFKGERPCKAHLLLGEVDRLGAELETAEEACGDAAAEVQRLRTLHEDEEGGA